MQPQPQRLASIQPGSWRTPNMSSTQRGYGYRWQKAREGHLRNNPLCRMCKDLDSRAVPATTVDHITPHRGDQALFWDRTNWQSLCSHHHSQVKQAQEAAYAGAGSPSAGSWRGDRGQGGVEGGGEGQPWEGPGL